MNNHKYITYKSTFLKDVKNYTDFINFIAKNKLNRDKNYNFLFNYVTPNIINFNSVKIEKLGYKLYSLNINCFIDKCDIISDITSNADLICMGSERTIFYDEKSKEYSLHKGECIIEIKQGEDILLVNKYFNRDFLTLDTKRIYLLFNKNRKIKNIDFSCFQHFLSEEDKDKLHSEVFQTPSEKHSYGMCISNRDRVINFIDKM